MNILYNKTSQRVDHYTYTVNQGGELDIKLPDTGKQEVLIEFKDGKFNGVFLTMGYGHASNRSFWYVMGSIAEEIARLEQQYADAKPAQS